MILDLFTTLARGPDSSRKPRETVASGGDVVREAQLYAEYSEHRRTTAQRAAGLSTFPIRFFRLAHLMRERGWAFFYSVVPGSRHAVQQERIWEEGGQGRRMLSSRIF
jgi:hypothetical protein